MFSFAKQMTDESPSKKSKCKDKTEQLLELYKGAYEAWIEITCAHDTDWLQSHDNVEKYPCERCMELHHIDPSEHGVTCGLCAQTKCEVPFIFIKTKDDNPRYVEFEEDLCEECRVRVGKALRGVCSSCMAKRAAEFDLIVCKGGACFYCVHTDRTYGCDHEKRVKITKSTESEEELLTKI